MANFDLIGTSVLVTGGTQGIGAAAVRIALARGANVLFCARTPADVEAARVEFRSTYGDDRVDGIVADVSIPADIDAAFASAAERFGPVGAVIHAAAILQPIGTILEVDPTAWLRSIEINLFGSFLITRAACATMRANGGGRIVLFSGGGAATPFPRYTAYACSKVAVVRLVESVALEMREFGIEINAIAPGFVATRMHDATIAAGTAAGDAYLERTKADLAAGGVPAELGAEAACYFVSQAARGISGRFIAAPWDDWQRWPVRKEEIAESDFFTLRRIVPRDRGQSWQ